MERIRVSYGGRVQGVGFRATARRIALDLPVTGWVRNEPDGSVTLEAQGEPADLDALARTLRERMGRLIHAERRTELSPAEGETGFEVRL
jgi:acylphosphatase